MNQKRNETRIRVCLSVCTTRKRHGQNKKRKEKNKENAKVCADTERIVQLRLSLRETYIFVTLNYKTLGPVLPPGYVIKKYDVCR